MATKPPCTFQAVSTDPPPPRPLMPRRLRTPAAIHTGASLSCSALPRSWRWAHPAAMRLEVRPAAMYLPKGVQQGRTSCLQHFLQCTNVSQSRPHEQSPYAGLDMVIWVARLHVLMGDTRNSQIVSFHGVSFHGVFNLAAAHVVSV